jgi:putative thioredoxin
VVEATDATFTDVVNRSLTVPAVLVLWSSQHPATRTFADDVARVAAGFEGRVLVVTADLQTNPGLLQAFQPLLVQAFGQPTIPAAIGLLQGQPVPLFPGVQPPEQVAAVLEQLVQAAVQNGVTGRVELGGAEEDGELPPLHQAAYDAIESGDLAAAADAYERALAENPRDTEAEAGLGLVRLLQRTEGVDLATARASAAERPEDVGAQLLAADLDVLGGHVEDAFGRLVDLVRATSGADRDRVRAHLLDLFAVVGNADERVRRGRTALMNALF